LIVGGAIRTLVGHVAEIAIIDVTASAVLSCGAFADVDGTIGDHRVILIAIGTTFVIRG